MGDFCVTPNLSFIQTWIPGRNELVYTVHEALDAGRSIEVGRSFGAFYDVHDPSATSFGHALSEALITCDEEAEIVVVAPRGSFDEIRGYTFAGEPVWRLVLEGFEGLEIQERPGGHQWMIPEEGYDMVYSLTAPFEDALLLQVAHKTVASVNGGLDFESIETYVIELKTGRARYGGRDWPPIVAADSECIVVKPNQIVPQLEVRCRR